MTSLKEPLGWRARIGLVIPQLDYLSEAIFPRVLPEGVSFHTSRLRRIGPVNIDTLGQMNASVLAALELLPTPYLDAVVYHCTMGSLLYDPQKLVDDMARQTGLPTIATSSAIVKSFRHLGVRKICLVTPYSQALNKLEADFLTRNGFEVCAIGGANIEDSGEMQSVAPEEINRWVRRAWRPECEAAFISCTGVRSHEFIDELEAEIGRPVATSLTVTLWDLYRLLKVPTVRPGLGTLFRN